MAVTIVLPLRSRQSLHAVGGQGTVYVSFQQDPAESRVLDQVCEVIRLRHYSIRTEQAYLQWISRFILFHHKRHPREMGATEVTAF